MLRRRSLKSLSRTIFDPVLWSGPLDYSPNPVRRLRNRRECWEKFMCNWRPLDFAHVYSSMPARGAKHIFVNLRKGTPVTLRAGLPSSCEDATFSCKRLTTQHATSSRERPRAYPFSILLFALIATPLLPLLPGLFQGLPLNLTSFQRCQITVLQSPTFTSQVCSSSFFLGKSPGRTLD